jgi:hypothetical protein
VLVLARKHQSTTALERNALRLQLAGLRLSSLNASGLIVDGRRTVVAVELHDNRTFDVWVHRQPKEVRCNEWSGGFGI